MDLLKKFEQIDEHEKVFDKSRKHLQVEHLYITTKSDDRLLKSELLENLLEEFSDEFKRIGLLTHLAIEREVNPTKYSKEKIEKIAMLLDSCKKFFGLEKEKKLLIDDHILIDVNDVVFKFDFLISEKNIDLLRKKVKSMKFSFLNEKKMKKIKNNVDEKLKVVLELKVNTEEVSSKLIRSGGLNANV